ncbi:MAG: hypothetical protein HFH14_04950, partial [Lachnospiraceae bacterium]|nr:hypothetical protein [Lachnospiraceae bacterium]
ERYRLEDFEIDGDYVDYIIVRSDFGGYDYADFMKGTVKYSLQRVNWNTGEIVSFHELPRPCQKLCGGFPYGTDMNSFYKYSKDGRECLWENMLPEGKASLGKRSRDVLKQKYCVTEGKLFYANVNGVYMLSTLENNSAPQRLITARECPALKDGLSIVVQILAVNEKCFYMTVSGENGRPDYLFRYRKR